MSFLASGPSIILYHILPSVLGAFVYFLLAQLFIFVFRVKKPSIRYLMYLIVLYKSILILITGVRYTNTMVPSKSFGFGTMLYDPLDLLPFGTGGSMTTDMSFQAIQSPWLLSIISITLSIIFSLILLRWFATAWFFKNISNDSKPLSLDINSFVKTFCSKLKISVPRIVINESDIGPMTIGILKPTIILPKWIDRSFSKEEIEVIVGHELAHVKRKDNLLQWLALFFRDILFFSPFGRMAYNFMQSNKEQAADSLFLRIMPEKSSLLAKTIKKVSSAPELPNKQSDILVAKAHFVDFNIIQKRLRLINKNTNVSHKLFSSTTSMIGLFLFFWVKAWIVVKVGQKGLMLLS